MGRVAIGCLMACAVLAVILSGSALLAPRASNTGEDNTSGASTVVNLGEHARRGHPGPIEESAADPYTRSQYPDTIRQFGSAIPEINENRQKASKISATYVDCDNVSNVQITTNSTRESRRYWADCSNGTRLYFDDSSILKGEAVDLQTKEQYLQGGLKNW